MTSSGSLAKKCQTNFSLSPRHDKLKLIGHQTDPLPAKSNRYLIVGVDAAVAQEGPVLPRLVDLAQVAIDHQDFLFVS